MSRQDMAWTHVTGMAGLWMARDQVPGHGWTSPLRLRVGRLHRRARERERLRLRQPLRALGGLRLSGSGWRLLDEDVLLGLAGEQPLELVLVDRLALDEDRRQLVQLVDVLLEHLRAVACASSITRRISSSISRAISSE